MQTKVSALLQAYGAYVAFVIIATYLGYSAGQAALRNYNSQEEILQLQQQLAAVQLERSRLESLVVYYRTDAFKEKELRRALLLVRPGETVYALPESSKVAQLDVDTRVVGTVVAKPTAVPTPNWRLWADELL